MHFTLDSSVVFKHSEECPLTGKLIEDIVNTILPDGVFNEIYGGKVEGEILIEQNITLISFTGSTTTGKKIYAKAGERFLKAVMEMGGSAPGIIYKDADLENTIESVFNLRFTNNGQCCDGLKRLIVHEDIYSDVLNSLKNLINKNKIGDPLDKDTFFGPLSAKRQQELLISQVDDAVKKGAIVEIGGKVPNNLKGAYYEPTILTKISKDMKVWQEEVFGPVLPIITFKTDEEAIELANDTPYGLGGYIFTKDKQKALKVASHLKTGMISINGVNYVNPWNPFGGYKNSGMGREHGHWGLKELTQVKIVVLNKD